MTSVPLAAEYPSLTQTSVRKVYKYPFVGYAAVTVVLTLGVWLLELGGNGYDDGAIGSSAFILSMGWCIFAFPAFFISELIFAINSGHAVPGHWFIVLAAHILLCIMAEVGLQAWRRLRG